MKDRKKLFFVPLVCALASSMYAQVEVSEPMGINACSPNKDSEALQIESIKRIKSNETMATVTFKGELTINLSGNLLAVGTQAPDFTLVQANLAPISLSELKGKRVVLNIFPSVDTGVCAASVRRFNVEAGKLNNTTVLNVSKDLPFALGRFCGAEGIENVLVGSDFRGGFGEAYGVLQIDGPLAGLLARAVVVLDEEGKVIYTELVPEISQDPNFEAALAVLS